MKGAGVCAFSITRTTARRVQAVVSIRTLAGGAFLSPYDGVVFLLGISFQNANEDAANLFEPTLWFVLLQAAAR